MRQRMVAIGAAVFFALAACAEGAGQGARTFKVLFPEVSRLEVGDPLVYRGLVIGEVRAVGFTPHGAGQVEIAVAPEHWPRVYREAVYKIERTDILGPERQVRMYDGRGMRTPVEPGDTIVGSPSLWREGWRLLVPLLGEFSERKIRELREQIPESLP